MLGAGEELLLVSEKGVIVRTGADAIPQQSRSATGVRLQRLDKGDRLADVVLVPPEAETDDDNESEASDEADPNSAADVVAEQPSASEESSEPSAED